MRWLAARGACCSRSHRNPGRASEAAAGSDESTVDVPRRPLTARSPSISTRRVTRVVLMRTWLAGTRYFFSSEPTRMAESRRRRRIMAAPNDDPSAL